MNPVQRRAWQRRPASPDDDVVQRLGVQRVDDHPLDLHVSVPKASGVRRPAPTVAPGEPRAAPPEPAQCERERPSRGPSSHCTSSIASSAGPRRATSLRTDRKAAPTARSSGGAPSASSSSSATRSALSCGAGSPGPTSSRTPARMSASPVNARPASASTGREISTRNPCSCADLTPAVQTVVLPIPASPGAPGLRSRQVGGRRTAPRLGALRHDRRPSKPPPSWHDVTGPRVSGYQPRSAVDRAPTDTPPRA